MAEATNQDVWPFAYMALLRQGSGRRVRRGCYGSLPRGRHPTRELEWRTGRGVAVGRGFLVSCVQHRAKGDHDSA
jgi:hypothetical protein